MLKRMKEKLKHKKEKGFTLIELLAVIVILAIIMVITIPIVLGKINESKQKAFSNVGETMKKYLEDNYKQCIISDGVFPEYDTALFDRENNCALKENISNTLITNSGYSTDEIEEVFINTDGEGKYEVVVKPKKDENSKFKDVETSTTGEINIIPNKPDISNGLVPVVYDEEEKKWKIVSENDPTWYDYSNQKWANAVILKNKEKGVGNHIEVDIENTPNKSSEELDIYAMYVWIPRFSYTIGCTDIDGKDGIIKNNTTHIDNNKVVIDNPTECLGYRDEKASNLSLATPGAIDIKFVSPKVKEKYNGDLPIYDYKIDANGMTSERYPSNWYTHPAFTFGNQELSGIWVGKFETSIKNNAACYGTATKNCVIEESEVRILPNVLSVTLQIVSKFFEISKDFTENSFYGLNSGDSHMMKNSEWGAMAYLSQSKYGKYGNDNYENVNKEIFINNSGTGSGSSSISKYTGRSFGSDSTNEEFNESGSYKYDVDNNGTGASTTGNVYGIYDTSGGAWEYVMGKYKEQNDIGGFSKEWFMQEENKKYFDEYEKLYEKKEDVIGHSSVETIGWYGDASYELPSKNWMLKSGRFNHKALSGVFHSYYNQNGTMGRTISFRSVLVNK